MNLDDLCIPSNASIFEAMKAIDRSTIAMAIVCDQGKVRGVVTDGDIRRAIIGGAKVEDSIESCYTRNCVTVGPHEKRADVLDLMQARVVEQIPVVDDRGKLRGVHTLHALLGNAEKPNRALIMAGGKGTRLGNITRTLPKPMVRVAGRPILERLVLHLVGYGVKHIYISVNHLSHVIEEYFGDGEKWGCRITYLREEEPLGSGGAISLIEDDLHAPLIMLNGDLFLEVNLEEMLKFHHENDFFATMGVHSYAHEIPYGCIEHERNRIVKMEEKPILSRKVNAGVYILSLEAVKSVPKNTFLPATWLIENALEQNLPCGAYPVDGDWIDIGVPDQLNKARGF